MQRIFQLPGLENIRGAFPTLRRAILALIAIIALLLSRPTLADDNDLEKQLKFLYVDNVLTLRHFFEGDNLRFHSDGTLISDTAVGPWTLDGQIEVKEIHFRGNLLTIKGRRIHVTFDDKSKHHDQLAMIDTYPEKDRDAMKEFLNHLLVEIEIELPTEKSDQEQISAVMNAVFLTPGASMVDIVPGYWRRYFEGKSNIVQDPTKSKDPIFVIKAGEISPPVVFYAPDPDYSDQARKAKYQGTSVIFVVVDASGSTRNLEVVRPLGLGLDEKAIAAISSWKFKPAQKDGKPVSVAINVEVNFHLY